MVDCILLAFHRKPQTFVWVLCDETLALGLLDKNVKHDPGRSRVPEDCCVLNVVVCVSFKICHNDTHQLKHRISTLLGQAVCDWGEWLVPDRWLLEQRCAMKRSKQFIKRVFRLVVSRKIDKQLGLQESRNVVRARLPNYRNHFVRINSLEQVRRDDHLFVAYSPSTSIRTLDVSVRTDHQYPICGCQIAFHEIGDVVTRLEFPLV